MKEINKERKPMNIVIGILVVVLIAIGVMSIAIGILMIITAKEIADAIKSFNLDKDADGRVKFIESETTQVGRSPTSKKSNKSNSRKN